VTSARSRERASGWKSTSSVGYGQKLGTRTRQFKAVDAFLEQADAIGADPVKDRAAKIQAIKRAGFVQFQTEEAMIRHFDRIWRGDDTRAYICQQYAMAFEEDPCPISFYARVVRGHMLQEDPAWGPKDRGTSLQAAAQFAKVFIPTQTSKVATLNLSARVERPAEFDVEPEMQARAILPAGQSIVKPEPPPAKDEDGDEDDEEGDDDEG